MYYKICFINICVLLIYAVIGFFLIKGKLVKKESIPDFAKLLMYICQPALLIYSFNEANYSLDLGKEADAVEDAVKAVLHKGYRTVDIMSEGKTLLGTKEMGDMICKEIED